MKPHISRCLSIAFLAGAVAVCVHLLRKDADDTERKDLAKQAVFRDPATAVNGLPSRVPSAEFGTPEFWQSALQRGNRWLDSRGRDAGGLIAMWNLTNDKSFLTEAIVNYPENPLACKAMIDACDGDRAAASPWIERLIALDPDNMEGLYLKAWVLMKRKLGMSKQDQAAAMSVVREAVNKGGYREPYLLQRVGTLREAALASGVPVEEAVGLALGVILQQIDSLAAASDVIMAEKSDALDSHNIAALTEIAQIGCTVADQFSNARPLTVGDVWASLELRIEVLDGLPDEVPVGSHGKTAGMIKAQAEKERDELTEWIFQQPRDDWDYLYKGASSEVIDEYFERFTKTGERDAITWLRESDQKK